MRSCARACACVRAIVFVRACCVLVVRCLIGAVHMCVCLVRVHVHAVAIIATAVLHERSAWAESANYMFFRNHFPDRAKLAGALRKSAGVPLLPLLLPWWRAALTARLLLWPARTNDDCACLCVCAIGAARAGTRAMACQCHWFTATEDMPVIHAGLTSWCCGGHS